MGAITLTTDFGTSDGYVGEVKGVLATRAPGAAVIDVAHDIPPGDITAAAWILSRIWTRFPADTVHLAVVDPGVGGERAPVAARLAERLFVGPDNGLLTLAARLHPVTAACRIDERIGDPLSQTFHGRDLCAPAAAHLAAGYPLEEIGSQRDPSELVQLPLPEPERRGDALHGHVVHVDRFGNLITTLPCDWLPPRPEAEVAGTVVQGLVDSYDAVLPGTVVLSRGSGGTLEIAVRDGSASRLLGVGRDEPVVVRAVH